jgi:hypothetical protein
MLGGFGARQRRLACESHGCGDRGCLTTLAHRDLFGLKRRSGPRKLRNAATPGLFTMRDLRLTPIAPSG